MHPTKCLYVYLRLSPFNVQGHWVQLYLRQIVSCTFDRLLAEHNMHTSHQQMNRVFFYNRCFSLTLNLFSDMTLKNRQPQ